MRALAVSCTLLAGCANALGPAIPPDATPGQIFGVVSRAAEREPLGGASVYLVSPRTDQGRTTTTDDLGNFAFHDLDPGSYVIRVVFHDAGEAVLVHLDAQNGQRVDVTLPDALLAF